MTTIIVPDAIDKAFADLAAEKSLSKNDLMLAALAEYLDLDKEAAAGLVEADEAWAEFEKTGEGVPLEEAAGWLASWGTPDPKRPQCRKL
jgi:predicted transcriptional regulator